VGPDLAALSDPVGTIDSLRFDCGIPPWIEQEDVLGRREAGGSPPASP
jgi:hypothetical protein